MARFINDAFIKAEKRHAAVCSVEAIQKVLTSGGLCMVLFCVEINWKLQEYGYPCKIPEFTPIGVFYRLSRIKLNPTRRSLFTGVTRKGCFL